MSPVDKPLEYEYGQMCTVTDTCEKHTLTQTEDSSTMLPVDEPLEYEYGHENKGTDEVWSFKDKLCRTETQKADVYSYGYM